MMIFLVLFSISSIAFNIKCILMKMYLVFCVEYPLQHPRNCICMQQFFVTYLYSI